MVNVTLSAVRLKELSNGRKFASGYPGFCKSGLTRSTQKAIVPALVSRCKWKWFDFAQRHQSQVVSVGDRDFPLWPNPRGERCPCCSHLSQQCATLLPPWWEEAKLSVHAFKQEELVVVTLFTVAAIVEHGDSMGTLSARLNSKSEVVWHKGRSCKLSS